MFEDKLRGYSDRIVAALLGRAMGAGDRTDMTVRIANAA